jgi:hypothetical protein
MKTVMLTLVLLVSAVAQPVNTGNPDGRIAVGSRPEVSPKIEIEAADDFVLNPGMSLSGVQSVTTLPLRGCLRVGRPWQILGT